jgi:hypothetical protein
MTHLTFEQISDLADSREPRTESRELLHLSECAECSETLRKVRGLVDAAHALPRDIAPPPEVWAALRTRVGSGSAPVGRARTTWAQRSWMAAAAAIILMVGAAVFVPRATGKAKASKVAQSVPAAPVPVRHVGGGVESSYSATLAELRRTLDTQRASLSPATVRVLERSLATIDTAIAEAREALASDPANEVLVKILSANYERKVELLQRATELSSSS